MFGHTGDQTAERSNNRPQNSYIAAGQEKQEDRILV